MLVPPASPVVIVPDPRSMKVPALPTIEPTVLLKPFRLIVPPEARLRALIPLPKALVEPAMNVAPVTFVRPE